jgi:hypothetical protein
MMQPMNESNTALRERFESGRWLRVGALAAALGFAALLRFDGLGARSLWADEFCTWRVSQMPPGESLRWGPELTKPPLYQLCLRAISADEKPSEKTLRLPAAVSGVLAVIVVWWLGAIAGGWTTGCAGALLLACNELQIDYSQEARSYSMLLLGSALSTGLWHQLNAEKSKSPNVQKSRPLGSRGLIAVAYVAVTVFAFHAHYLMLLTVAGQAAWWAMTVLPIGDWRLAIDGPSKKNAWHGLPARFSTGPIAMATAGLFCVPIVWHYLRYRTSAFQGLDWIAPPTWGDAISVLGKLTFGPVWVVGLLAPAVLAVTIAIVQSSTRAPNRTPSASAGSISRRRKRPGRSLAFPVLIQPLGQAEVGASGTHPTNADAVRSLTVAALFRRALAGRNDLCGLLLCWLGAAWFGLMVISWLAHPAMVARYALPAAVPAILLPLIVAHRIDPRAPAVIAIVFFVASAGQWTGRSEKVMPGFREMVEFLNEVVDPDREAVAVVIDRATSPGWEEMDLLGFDYYPLPPSQGGTEAGWPIFREAEGGGVIKAEQANHRILAPGSTRLNLGHPASNLKSQISKGGSDQPISQSPKRPIELLYLHQGKLDGDQPILHDPRALWLVVFLADPEHAVESAGREMAEIRIDDRSYQQLLFAPYRVMLVAPRSAP